MDKILAAAIIFLGLASIAGELANINKNITRAIYATHGWNCQDSEEDEFVFVCEKE